MPKPHEPNELKVTFRGVLREPTTHFVLLALALFLAADVIGSRNDVIDVDPAEIERRIEQIERERGGSLTPEQRAQVEEDFIDELVLAREARQLVLKDDPRIHDLLVQTMLLFLRSDVVQPPTESELDAYYEANRARYTPAVALTVDEFLLEPSGLESRELPAFLRADVEPNQIASDALIRHRQLARLGPADLTRLFDAATAQAVLDAELTEWVGPYRSDRGDHWLRIREKQGGGEVLALDSVRNAVRQDWITEQEQTRFQGLVAELLEKYTIRFTDAGERGSTGPGDLEGGSGER